ncbi:hypothetical protein [Pseudoteredinibacter isoporae]|uniref:Uncharacterized protein n=1 Tax=Pseudoteredinibacter isoporae TaxID=570281 RepID=A0A7X0JU93_9GAMM|nr:hypothetical protein [Pseudoteredinibacter isoporae]MBB6521939.1 hypothetical protein [Pseudoteredinibacter isoporae]NHO87476.1 hypothetical protein [Pseudoteredinibacter isoporae]NIB24193.1 hypothetical protein [Pseudoteredinibacter isoporae]
MRFNKHMIDLLREIRRRVPSHQKPSIKLANPELIDELYIAYEQSRDSICQLLIREFIEQNRSLGEPLREDRNTRHVTIPQLSGATKVEPENQKAERPKRVYRGQIVEA